MFDEIDSFFSWGKKTLRESQGEELSVAFL